MRNECSAHSPARRTSPRPGKAAIHRHFTPNPDLGYRLIRWLQVLKRAWHRSEGWNQRPAHRGLTAARQRRIASAANVTSYWLIAPLLGSMPLYALIYIKQPHRPYVSCWIRPSHDVCVVFNNSFIFHIYFGATVSITHAGHSLKWYSSNSGTV